MINTKLIGKIGVDSGTIWIGDPCYLRTEITSGDIDKAIHKAWDEGKHAASLNFRLGHEGAGIITSTHSGDGTYDVYGVYKDGEPRPIQIIIEFEPLPDERGSA